jgi:hypothetical protein
MVIQVLETDEASSLIFSEKPPRDPSELSNRAQTQWGSRDKACPPVRPPFGAQLMRGKFKSRDQPVLVDPNQVDIERGQENILASGKLG